MRTIATLLNLLAFFMVIYGLSLVFRQVNDDARWADRSSKVARGFPPPEYEAYAKWMLMEPGQQSQIESALQAEHLTAGIAERQRGAKIAFVGAVLVLVAGLLPLWWS